MWIWWAQAFSGKHLSHAALLWLVDAMAHPSPCGVHILNPLTATALLTAVLVPRSGILSLLSAVSYVCFCDNITHELIMRHYYSLYLRLGSKSGI